MKNFVLFTFLSLGTTSLAATKKTIDQPATYQTWASHRNLSYDNYMTKLDTYKKKGMRPIDVEIHVKNGKRKYSIVMRHNYNNVAWLIKTKLSHSEFSAKWKEMKNKGYRLLDQEAYRIGAKNQYAGIWIKNKNNLSWVSQRNLKNDDFKANFQKYKKEYFPIDLESYRQGSTLKHSVIWVKNTDKITWTLNRNIKKDDFSKHFAKRKNAGYRLYRLEGYRINAKQYFSTIWIKDKRRWKARRDMSGTWYKNYWSRYRDEGYRPETISIYPTSNGPRYASIWVQNQGHKIKWTKKTQTQNLISSHLNSNKAMGATVAVYHKGKTRYIRGFGYRNKQNSEWADSKTIYRYASVSKAITGTLGFILEDKGILNLNEEIQSVLPALPIHHSYKLGDLLTNRSGVRHYLEEDDPVWGLGQISAWSAVQAFMNDPLSSSSYLYSTHAYTIFAAAVEEESNSTYCTEVRKRIATVQNLSTLRCENRNVSKKNRSILYRMKDDNSLAKTSADNLSWKYAGGGLESSVSDLLKFGVKLSKGNYMKEARVTQMTTRPDAAKNYAYGWNVGTQSSHRWFAKAGDQRGGRAYLRIYPDQNLVIAYMANTRSNDTYDYQTLVRNIADLILP